MAPGWRITAERACAGRNAPTWPNADFISSIMRLGSGTLRHIASHSER